MIILGIDPGLAATGYAVIIKQKRQNLKAVTWGVIETAKNTPLQQRLAIIARDLQTLIKRHKPGLAVIESVYFAKNAKTAIVVAHARGVLLLTAKLQKVKILELTPLQVKSQVTGYGAAPKQQVQFMVKRLLKLHTVPKPDDAADALALAICGATKQ